jgi:putative restriction endonuclease
VLVHGGRSGLLATGDDRGGVGLEDCQDLADPGGDLGVEAVVKLGIDPDRPPEIGGFSAPQESFLKFHRAEIFRSARLA